MFDRYITKHLREGEGIKEIVHQTPLKYLWRWFWSGVLLLAPLFFLLPLSRLGLWGIALGGVSVLIGIWLLVRTLFIWSVNVFVLTVDRVVDVDQRGFFTTVVSSAAYDKIQDVSFAIRGVLQAMLRQGSVVIQTAGTETQLELDGVSDPQRIQQLITDLVKDKTVNPARDTVERLVEMLESVPAKSKRSIVKSRPQLEESDQAE